MKIYRLNIFLLFTISTFLTLCGGKTQGRVYFKAPIDGSTVSSPVKVSMGVEGFEVVPAGDIVPGTGHHHIIINGEPVSQGEIIPKDENHLHFGKGQTETELKFKPGMYTLTLQFADGGHKSYGPKLSSTIKINVK